MRPRFTGATVLSALLTLLAAALLQQSLGLGPAARSVPLKVCIGTLAILLFQLAIDLFPAVARRFAFLERRELIGVRTVRERIHPAHLRVREHPTVEDPDAPSGEGSAFAWMGAMLACATLLGFAAGGPLFALAYLRLHGRRGWGTSLAVACGLAAFLVVVFGRIFEAPLYRGQLWAWLGL